MIHKLPKTLISVGTFTDNRTKQSDIECRWGGKFAIPEGKTFAEYVRDALADELEAAGMLSQEADLCLNGTLDQLEMSSSSSTWKLQITIHSSNGKSLTVADSYKFSSRFIVSADKACEYASEGFLPAVQNLVFNIVTEPDFQSLF